MPQRDSYCFLLVIQIIMIVIHSPPKILYSLDSKPGGLLSKRGSHLRTCPLLSSGAYFWEGAYYPDYTVHENGLSDRRACKKLGWPH